MLPDSTNVVTLEILLNLFSFFLAQLFVWLKCLCLTNPKIKTIEKENKSKSAFGELVEFYAIATATAAAIGTDFVIVLYKKKTKI